MFIIPITFDELSKIKKIKKWTKNLHKLSFNKDVDINKVEFICQFGFFVPKGHNTPEKFSEAFEENCKLEYGSRLEVELSKIRVNIGMKHNKFFISDRLPKGVLPKVVKNIVAELTKVKMMVESEMHDNLNVKRSIPQIDKNIVNIEVFRDIANSEIKRDFNLDDILDKIIESGVDSLSDDEKDFLDKSSKKGK